MNALKILVVAFATISALPGACLANGGKDLPVPTHAEAAVIIVKYFGLFDGKIDPSASLSDCVSFLNRLGVYMGLMQVVNGTEFTESDFARVMGQLEQVFSGEAEYVDGKVKLPKEVDGWESFCKLNEIKFKEGYLALREVLLEMKETRE